MDKREQRRLKRRLPCRFEVQGRTYRGITLDLSTRALFVQTDAMLAPGTELDLTISRAVGGTPVVIRAAVVRRRAVPATLASVLRRGLGLRVVDAPGEYEQLCTSEHCVGPVGAQRPVAKLQSPPATAATRAPRAPEPAGPQAGPARIDAPTRRTARAAEKTEAPTAVLLDAGDLDDIERVLEELEVSTVRMDARMPGGPETSRLLVASARLALSPSMAPLAEGRIGIAVADAHSQTLANRVRRLGFRYLVSRPVHPDALRILIQECLYSGSERRGTPRFAHGSEVTWRTGLRRHRATLVEISGTSGRLHARMPLEVGSTIGLTLQPEAGLAQSLLLRARVVRGQRRFGYQHQLPHAIALCWLNTGECKQEHLDALLAVRSMGPARQSTSVTSGAAAPDVPEEAARRIEGLVDRATRARTENATGASAPRFAPGRGDGGASAGAAACAWPRPTRRG